MKDVYRNVWRHIFFWKNKFPPDSVSNSMRTMDGRTDGIPCKLYTAATAHQEQDWEDPSFLFRLFSEQYMIGRELQIPKCNRHYIDSSPQYIVANALFVIKTAIQINWRHSTTHPHQHTDIQQDKRKKKIEKSCLLCETLLIILVFSLAVGCQQQKPTHTHSLMQSADWI